MTQGIAERLKSEVTDPIKERFVGRDEVIDLIALAAVAGEHLFLLGPPGTAKSALIREFALAVRGRYFEYMLTRFSEPNEIFGPIDIVRLREGVVATVVAGMLPEAEFVFLDELFNANSAILNNLLTVLNERIYRRGLETHRLPLLSLYSASNHLPEDQALQALFDRFLVRCHVRSLEREALPRLLAAGWALESHTTSESSVSAEEIRSLSSHLYRVDLSAVMEPYMDALLKIRDLGIGFTDRRAVKVQKLLAASATLCGRTQATAADLWVLRYVWDREEQIEPLAALINGILELHPNETQRHALSLPPAHVDGEQIARQLNAVEKELNDGAKSLSALARLKEQVTHLADQAAWISDQKHRDFLLTRARQFLERLG
ncbi:MAG TPA: AAA family ATPase [Gemmataceae bacterium]|jgi:MoxR-like ATPase|nr:AAA family ATPase [Gemmataceae bacterium]